MAVGVAPQLLPGLELVRFDGGGVVVEEIPQEFSGVACLNR